MNSKDNKKNVKILIGLTVIVFLTIIFIGILNRTEKVTYATEDINNMSELKVSNAVEVDLDTIIKANSVNTGYKEKILVKKVELEYITKYRANNEIYIGETAVSQEGRNGVQAITTKMVYDENGKLISKEQVSAVVVKSSINKVIDIGTRKKEVIKPKVIQKGTTSNPNGLSFDVPLNCPSGFTLEQFKKALTDSKDKNKIFEKNAEYFYYIEKQYNINGMFVAAIGVHESAWGTSRIALNKHNLFGYGAYDSNPYNGAYQFDDYSEAIDLIARVLTKYYLNPNGTKIYDNGVANGKYYNGNTLSAVNKKYASDKGWASKVYSHMQYLYSKAK